MSVKSRKIVAAALAFALCASSTSALAASTQRSATAATINPWVALSAFDSNAAAALGGSAIAGQSNVGETARDDDSRFGRPPLLALSVILGALATAAWIALKDRSRPEPQPVSPD